MKIGQYCSPKVPVRQLCQAITVVLNGISPENIIILGDFNVNWLIDTEKRPLYNLLVNNKHYKQLISTYTTDSKTVIDHIIIHKHSCGEPKYSGSCFRNISLII